MYGQHEMTDKDREAQRRYERFYPANRPTYIGDILMELSDIKQMLMKIIEKQGETT